MSTANPSRPTGRSFRLVCPPEQMPQVESLLRAQGYEFEPEPFSPFCRRLLCEPRPLGSSLAAFFGYVYIQDRSSMLPPLALAPRQGEAVLDMCASPGSKTGFLGQLTGPDGFVLGNELSRARLATLRANLHACNLSHVGTCSFEGQALPLTPGTWDAIQLDPPCSGWGTVEKNPQVLKLWQGDKLKGLVGLQQLLLAHAARLLRPGGRVVFSTCTTNDDENEAQVRFAEEELGLVREHLTPFEGFVWEQRPGGEGTLRVDGERSAAQGFYVALLRKPADAPLPELPPVSAGPDARTAARNAARGRNRRDARPALPQGQVVSRSALAGPCCDPGRLPAGEARIYGEQVRFIPAHADLLLPPGFTWQGALLGRMAGGRLHMAPRLRCLLPAVPDPAHSLVLDDISDITALLSGQSRQTGLAGNEAALWWRDLPLARMMLKQGRATLSFN